MPGSHERLLNENGRPYVRRLLPPVHKLGDVLREASLEAQVRKTKPVDQKPKKESYGPEIDLTVASRVLPRQFCPLYKAVYGSTTEPPLRLRT